MIGVIAGYRTGSSTLVRDIGDTFNLVRTQRWTSELDFLEQHYRPPFARQQLYKIMPIRVKDERWHQFCEDWIRPSVCFYSVREDITAQIKSLAFAYATSIFHPNEDNKELLTWTNTFNHHRGTDYKPHQMQEFVNNEIDETALENYKPAIIKNLNRQKELFERFGGKVITLESRCKDLGVTSYTYPVEFPRHLMHWDSNLDIREWFDL